MSVTISDIESGMLALLQERWTAAGITERVEEFNVGMDFGDLLGVPAVSLATENIGVERIADATFKISPAISLYIAFKNPADPAMRRAGIYPLVIGTIAILANQKLGLDIDPLIPGDAAEIYHAALKEKGLIGFKLTFTTSFDIEMVGDGVDLVKLAAIVANYMRQDPAQEEPDMSDEIEIPQEE